jgi:hypothetical protein
VKGTNFVSESVEESEEAQTNTIVGVLQPLFVSSR